MDGARPAEAEGDGAIAVERESPNGLVKRPWTDDACYIGIQQVGAWVKRLTECVTGIGFRHPVNLYEVVCG
jgi:hypothetical protein